jgi:hypothetical protein
MLNVRLLAFSRPVSESRCKVSFTIHQKSIFCDETTYFDDETKKEGIEKGEIGYQDLKSKQHLYVITSQPKCPFHEHLASECWIVKCIGLLKKHTSLLEDK